MSKFRLDHRSVKNVKVILGNGFDLACGLKSGYMDFFDASKTLYEPMKEWIRSPSDTCDFDDSLTAWDLLFFVLKKEESLNVEDVKWNHVESVIRLALGLPIKGKTATSFSFESLISKSVDSIPLNDKEDLFYRYLRSIESKRNYTDVFHSRESFYGALYQELERFETRFSKYIDEETKKGDYEKKAEYLLFKEMNFVPGELKSVDTFNFTTPKMFLNEDGKDKVCAFRHINGQIGKAIFGIDANGVKIDDERYIFTKTYRKMMRIATDDIEQNERRFQNLVFFGHSMSEPDFSYLFSVLDSMNLYMFQQWSSRIYVVYYDYIGDGVTVAKGLAINLLRLLDAFDKWKNPQSERYGLIETLQASQRIAFIKINDPKDFNMEFSLGYYRDEYRKNALDEEESLTTIRRRTSEKK